MGEEGDQIKHALYENTAGLKTELSLILMDYNQNNELPEILIEQLYSDLKEVFDKDSVAKILGIPEDKLNEPIKIKGYRILARIPKINKVTIEKMINNLENLSNIYSCDTIKLREQADISDKQAELVKDQLNKMYDTINNKIYKM